MVTLQKSTQDLICQSLRSRIASGDLEPGTELKQVELAKTYGVSRMPIREALQSLMLEGLVTRLSNRHMVVSFHAREILGNRKVPRTEENEALEPEPKTAGTPAYRVETEPIPETIGKIHLLPAREQVASYLRKAILRREIPEGSVLTLEETAEMVSIGPTTSMRMEKFEKDFIPQTGVKLIVGKGGMGQDTMDACQKYKTIFCVFPAGCAVVSAVHFKKIIDAQWKDLGMPETLWTSEVEELGPLIVAVDTKGGNLFEENKKTYKKRAEEVYEEIIPNVRFIK